MEVSFPSNPSVHDANAVNAHQTSQWARALITDVPGVTTTWAEFRMRNMERAECFIFLRWRGGHFEDRPSVQNELDSGISCAHTLITWSIGSFEGVTNRIYWTTHPDVNSLQCSPVQLRPSVGAAWHWQPTGQCQRFVHYFVACSWASGRNVKQLVATF